MDFSLSFIVFSLQTSTTRRLRSGALSVFFSCVSITRHICLGDILIKINLSSYSPSQTVTTTAIQTKKKKKVLATRILENFSVTTHLKEGLRRVLYVELRNEPKSALQMKRPSRPAQTTL